MGLRYDMENQDSCSGDDVISEDEAGSEFCGLERPDRD